MKRKILHFVMGLIRFGEDLIAPRFQQRARWMSFVYGYPHSCIAVAFQVKKEQKILY